MTRIKIHPSYTIVFPYTPTWTHNEGIVVLSLAQKDIKRWTYKLPRTTLWSRTELLSIKDVWTDMVQPASDLLWLCLNLIFSSIKATFALAFSNALIHNSFFYS